jgi:hypothetical protein
MGSANFAILTLVYFYQHGTLTWILNSVNEWRFSILLESNVENFFHSMRHKVRDLAKYCCRLLNDLIVRFI